MAKIRLDDDSLRRDSKNLEKRLNEFEELSTELKLIIDTIGETWTGEASVAYCERMRRQSDKVSKIKVVTETYKGYVDKAIDEMVELDRTIAERIRNAF